MTVLIVDDELYIRRLLRNTLERAGYTVSEAANGADALAAAGTLHPTAILLDLGLPDRDGLELVGLLKRLGDPIILVVSAREATDQKVAALDLGADDYITKPFDSEEILARLRVALRNRGATPAMPTILRSGDIEIDFEHRVVRRNGEETHLTRKEYDVLATLATAPGKVITHQRIMDVAWPTEQEKRVEYLRIVVRNLRLKLEGTSGVGTVIANELGIGYRLLLDR
ncbi:response regulator transcription factor [Sphingomonas sp. PB2P19]|uniref:response regulator transcription factor n=1 Tax=Sphingomonas rhamnosi TaxID=3096156 RepID=UPI002FC91826